MKVSSIGSTSGVRTTMKACMGVACANAQRQKAAQHECWHVAVIACLLTCLASALTRSSGFLYVGIMEQYDADHAEASWPIAVASVLNNMAGLVAGPICQKIGAVPVLHAGCVIMWLSLITSSFSRSITGLTFTMGALFGRLGLPVLADRGYIRRSTLTMLNYSLMAVCMFALPFSSSYATLLVVCMFVALFQGCGIPLYPALMAEYIGLERLPIGYGIVGTVAGPLFLLNPLFIGYFRDKRGSYDDMYKFQSLTLILLGVTWMIVVCAETRRKGTWTQCRNNGENLHILSSSSSLHSSGKYQSFSCS
ncbi:monocarboxylate transporter 14-like isoform X5 [Dermacentor albipictus]|uniref:monocarboxylate transporter 14-like isoform X5 n=1 Tax=Dermacentor albipictus TaxID=60249 RepID=UPI0031FE104A